MIIYVLTFIISLCFMAISLILMRDKSKRIVAVVLLLIAFIVPCILAAIRDERVGTDIITYLRPYYDLSTEYDEPQSYMQAVYNISGKNDILFQLLCFYSQKLFNSFSMLMFLVELIVLLTHFYAFKRLCKSERQLLFCMFLFFMIPYNLSYNMMRQMIALGFCLLSFGIITTSRTKFDTIKIVLCMTAACLNQITSVTFLAILLLYKLFTTSSISESIKKKIPPLVLFVSIVSLLSFPLIMAWSRNIGGRSTFKFFVDNFSNGEFDLPVFNLLFYGYFLLTVVLIGKKMCEKNEGRFYKCIAIVALSGSMLVGYIEYADRIAYYFLWPILFGLIPRLITLSYRANYKGIHDKRIVVHGAQKEITLGKLSLICASTMAILYWYIQICVYNFGETIPYVYRGWI